MGGARAADAPDELKPAPSWFGAPGLPARQVAGRVTFQGQPVEGADVRLTHVLTQTGYWPAPTVRTGRDGRFDFGKLAAVNLQVGARAAGKTAATLMVDLRDPSAKPPSDQLELKLDECNWSIFGTVRDAGGGPVAAAAVRQSGIIGVETGADGNYELCLAPGFVEVIVEAPGYGRVVLGTELHGRGRVRRDVVLVPEGIVAGTVVRRGDGTPVAGASVWLWPFDWGRDRPDAGGAISDETGAFRVTGLNPTRYRLGARMGDLGTEGPVEVLVRGGETTDGVRVEVSGMARVSGTVREAGKPVAGVSLQAQRKSPMGYSNNGFSQEDGSFTILQVPRGEVRFVAHEYEVLKPESLKVEGETSGVVVEVASMAMVRGKVTQGGKPVAGADVRAFAGGQGLQATSKDDGRYELRGVPPGELKLTAASDKLGAFEDRVKVRVEKGEVKEGVDIELGLAATIAGDVVDQKGKPVAGARVVFTHAKTNDVGICTTDETGKYRCDSMTGGGDYLPKVFPTSELGAPFPPVGGAHPPVALVDGSSHVEGVRLSIVYSTGSIEGKVVDGAGAPVADARVVALMTKPGEDPMFRTWQSLPGSRSDAEGDFVLSGLSDGNYALKATDASGSAGIARDVKVGQKGVVIAVVKGSGIRGTLSGYRQPPPVYVATAGDTAFRFFPASVSGNTFHIDGLSPGTYVVTAQTLEEGDAELVEVKAGATSEVALASQGSGVLEGLLVEQGTGKPIAGSVCHTVLRAGSYMGITNWSPDVVPKTDAQGKFTLSPAPAGDVIVTCFQTEAYSMAEGQATVPRGGRQTVRLTAVRRADDSQGSVGLSFNSQLSIEARVVRVMPGGPAAQAGVQVGDLVVSVDGVDATALGPLTIEALIRNHPVGGKLTLGVKRGGEVKSFVMAVVLAD